MESSSTGYKVIIVGDGAVGKSTLITQLIKNEFNPQKMTVGFEHKVYIKKIDSTEVALVFWDLGGQKQFIGLHNTLFRGIKAAIFVYDVSRMTTFENLPKWMQLAENNGPDKYMKFLIGNKCDLELSEQQEIKQEFIDDLCNKWDILEVFKTSAKTNQNVKETFDCIAQILFENDKH